MGAESKKYSFVLVFVFELVFWLVLVLVGFGVFGVFVFSNLNVDPSNEGGRREQGSQKPEEVTDSARLNIIVVNI